MNMIRRLQPIAFVDEHDPSTATDCIRLHRLVRQIAAARHTIEAKIQMLRELTRAAARVYPQTIYRTPSAWPRARRLDAIAMALVHEGSIPLEYVEGATSILLNQLAAYRQGSLAAYDAALPLLERSLAICKKIWGANHPETASTLNNLGILLSSMGRLSEARLYHEEALAIYEEGRNSAGLGASLGNLGSVLQSQGDLEGARPLLERALVIRESVLGAEHPQTAVSLNNLGGLLKMQGEWMAARQYYERALSIREKVLGPNHIQTAIVLNNIGSLLVTLGKLSEARSYLERSFAIRENALGYDHPDTAVALNNLASLMLRLGESKKARAYMIRSLAIFELKLGQAHPDTRKAAENLAQLLEKMKLIKETRVLRQKFNL